MPVKAQQQQQFLALGYIQTMMAITRNNGPLALTIFEKLFKELPLQVIAINNAMENKHYDLAHQIIHKLNGSASFCGLTDIQQSAKTLESCLLNNDYSTINQHFLMLQQHISNFTCHQTAILEKLATHIIKKSP